MAITRTKIRGKELILIEGIVDGFYINPIPEDKIKTYAGKQGPWRPTHRYNLIVDGERISLGMGDKDGVSERQQIRAKDNEDNYHTIVKGLEVSVEVEENGEYQGKTQYQSTAAKVVVLDASKAQAPAQQNAQTTKAAFKPKDMSGVESGQGINGAMNFLLTWGVEASNENIVKYSKLVHNATMAVKEYVKETSPDVPEYDRGARAGLAVLTACKLVGTDAPFEQSLVDIAKDLLENVFPPVLEYVKTPAKESPPARVTKAPAAAKKPSKAPKKEEPEHDADIGSGFDDLDDTIPF